MKKAKIILIAAIILSIITLVLVLSVRAGAGGKTDRERVLEEIVDVYRWERYAYTVQDAKLMGEQKQGARHYIVTVYAADEETLYRYEFICSVTDDDVDFELLKKEICDDY